MAVIGSGIELDTIGSLLTADSIQGGRGRRRGGRERGSEGEGENRDETWINTRIRVRDNNRG